MNIKEIFDRILLRSGQFILKKKNIEIDVDNFRILVEDALSEYSGFVPYVKSYRMNFNSNRSFKFTETFDGELGRAPDWIASANPISSFGSIANVFTPGFPRHPGQSVGTVGDLVEPVQAPWDYNKHNKTLTVAYSAFYKVEAVYEHIVEKIADTQNEYEVKTITYKDQPFFKILQGMFLMGVGRSRRAFTLSDLPILMDADTLVSDGQEILTQAMEEIKDDQKIFLAYD